MKQEFIDFKKLLRSEGLNLLFPEWKKGEKVAFLSPHDDDVILGAGYLLSAVVENGGIPLVYIFSGGDAGYSVQDEKDSIVERRQREAVNAYKRMGVSEENIYFFGLPDFSVMLYINRRFPQGEGVFDKLVGLFREKKVSRVVFSSGNFENWDHTAVFYIGMYIGPQSGDPVLPDLGETYPVRTYIVYSVWGDFEPQGDKDSEVLADFGILASQELEVEIMEAIRVFSSQREIIEDIVTHRKKRKLSEQFIELYRNIHIRKSIEYNSYFNILPKCKKC